MSSEPLKASHMQPVEPFPLSGDFTVQEQPRITLATLNQRLIDGFSEVNQRIDALGVRVVKLEADAAWKRWAIRVAKAAVPFVAGYVAHRFPELAEHLPALLEAVQ